MISRRRFLIGAAASPILIKPARAFIFTPTQFFPPGITPVTAIYASNGSNATAGNPQTYTAAGIGAAAANRQIVVAVANATNAEQAATVSIAGIGATQIATQAGSSGIFGSLWAAAVPTGSTGDIVVTYTSTPGTRAGYIAWALYGASASASATSGSAASPGTTTLNCPANGAIIAAAQSSDGPNSWTGLTKDVDAVLGGGSFTQTGASQSFASTQTGLSITVTYNSGGNQSMVCASWGPA